MNKVKLLLKYIQPYRISAARNIFFNILSALFALFSYTLIIPFLKILFDRVETVPDPGSFQLSLDYISAAGRYYLHFFIQSYGETGALMLVSFGRTGLKRSG